MISVNKKSQELVNDLIDNSDYYRVSVSKGHNGSVIIDAGIKELGNMEAGRVISEICLGGIGRVHILNTFQNNEWPLTVNVNTNDPVIACLGSQYAGWSLSSKEEGSKFNALGSGPARVLALKEPLFSDINYSDKSDKTCIVMEVDSFPPNDVIDKISNDTGVDPKNLTIIITPTSSIAGNIQVVSRVLEVALHKAHELQFPMSDVIEGFGSAPIPPTSPDFLTAMGRTNDAIIFAGITQLLVSTTDEMAEELCNKMPSSTSNDYGKPFADIFKEYEYDFFKIDANLFSPSKVIISNTKTGNTFISGKIDDELMKKSFGI
ncbi:MAG: methenyltetrahydromethanopterin cyclohydrolase [Gammaproteobacteria bacterium]|nr:methenyltetrahydromethanopterin cyclohydrolase [Gammaproteobacteria bacterium]